MSDFHNYDYFNSLLFKVCGALKFIGSIIYWYLSCPLFAVISVEKVQVQWQTLYLGFAQVFNARPTFMILNGVFTLMGVVLFFFF